MTHDIPPSASETPTDYVQQLVDILARLRAPDGCPWDREQTHGSLKRYIVEEAGELLDAIDDEDDEAMIDELGDVLLQIALQCQIARERGSFDLQTAARRCCEKMIRRHPHVFGSTEVADSADVVDQWDRIKRGERAGAEHESAVGGIPRHLPALHRAQKIQKQAAKVGFDWPSLDGVLAKIEEELAEVREALREGDEEAVAEEIGDLLFAVVNLSRFRKHHAEDLLQDTVRKFEKRFLRMEEMLAAGGRRLEQYSLSEMDDAWERAKSETG